MDSAASLFERKENSSGGSGRHVYPNFEQNLNTRGSALAFANAHEDNEGRLRPGLSTDLNVEPLRPSINGRKRTDRRSSQALRNQAPTTVSPRREAQKTSRTNCSNNNAHSVTDPYNELTTEMKGEFVETDVANFVKSYLPFEPTDANVKKIMANEAIVEDRRIFKEFKDVPSEAMTTENMYFRTLQTIADKISSVQLMRRPLNRFNFRLCPNSQIASGILGSNNKIDTCITPDDSNSLTAIGIAVAFEFKMNAKELSNNAQVVSANVQIMNDDPRCMFTFGYEMLQKDQSSRFFRTEITLSEYRSNNTTDRMPRISLVGEYASTEDTVPPKAHFVVKNVWFGTSAPMGPNILLAMSCRCHNIVYLGQRQSKKPKNDIAAHNFQHDLESLWWVLIWTLISRITFTFPSELASQISKNTILILPDRKFVSLRISKTNSLRTCNYLCNLSPQSSKI
ncbi:hypothetical protein BDN70DRAFT_919607 [Pholiota conissans]|uniref:Uncharacterized protein n=1 Tax=Pholiota conissans TaxID=109636 RepID=A0A9P6CVI8_9AGAR|nr:hypothetical protein BDN70DRAFT_919607 [Pholiota conissans]